MMLEAIAQAIKFVIAGFIPATHGSKCMALEFAEKWVAGINPTMTEEESSDAQSE